MGNTNLHSAKKAKKDEFYTRWNYIQEEINAYLEFNPNVFKNKTILLPCDDPEWSNFTRFFAKNFEIFGLKKLISTSYAVESKQYNIEFKQSLLEKNDTNFDQKKTKTKGKIFILDEDISGDGKIDIDDLKWEYLDGDGSFDSDEVNELRDQADIIITNPPFSKFPEFLTWAMKGDKKFLVIGNMNSISYKETFYLIKTNKIWIGATCFNKGMYFNVPDTFEYTKTYKFKREIEGEKVNRVPSVCWYTNLDHGRRHSQRNYMSKKDNIRFNKDYKRAIKKKKAPYKKYDNYEGIEIPYVTLIPKEYTGIMGVPITFLGKYNPSQFEIVDLNPHFFEVIEKGLPKPSQLKIQDYSDPYARILIKRK